MPPPSTSRRGSRTELASVSRPASLTPTDVLGDDYANQRRADVDRLGAALGPIRPQDKIWGSLTTRLKRQANRQADRSARLSRGEDPWKDWATNEIPIQTPVKWPGNNSFHRAPPGVPEDISKYLIKLKKQSGEGLADLEGSVRSYMTKQKELWEKDLNEMKPQLERLDAGFADDAQRGLDPARPAAESKRTRRAHLLTKMEILESSLREANEKLEADRQENLSTSQATQQSVKNQMTITVKSLQRFCHMQLFPNVHLIDSTKIVPHRIYDLLLRIEQGAVARLIDTQKRMGSVHTFTTRQIENFLDAVSELE